MLDASDVSKSESNSLRKRNALREGEARSRNISAI